MAKKGLPPEGINALMAAWDDDNEMILNQDKKKREQANKEFRDYVKNKK